MGADEGFLVGIVGLGDGGEGAGEEILAREVVGALGDPGGMVEDGAVAGEEIVAGHDLGEIYKVREESASFLKKRRPAWGSNKLLQIKPRAVKRARRRTKSFLLPQAGRLFFKKEALAYFGHPNFIAAGVAGKAWMPAFAGMTGDEVWGLNTEFFYHYQPKPDSKLAPPRSIP